MMKRVGWLLISGIFLLTACSSLPMDLKPYRQTIIDWVDFIKINGEQYEYVRTGVIADADNIGQQIGAVNYKLSGNVTNPHYQPKDGDAAFWDKGTEIYTVKNEPSLIAVPDHTAMNGYRMYYNTGDPQGYVWHYEDLPPDEVTEAEIYRRSNDRDRTLVKHLTDSGEINPFMTELNEGDPQNTFTPNTSDREPTTYEMVFFIPGSSLAYTFELFFDGTHFYWYSSEASILSDDIRKYLH